MIFQCSINKKMVNKDREATGVDTSWELFEGDVNALLEHILNGTAFLPAVQKDYNKSRTTENFSHAELISLDVDNKGNGKHRFAYNDALNDKFIQKHALFIYTTPNHTEDQNRFRIVFHVEEPIADKSGYKDLVIRLIKRFGSDTTTSSPASYFYGNNKPNAKYKIFYNSISIEKILEIDESTEEENKMSKLGYKYNGKISKELFVEMLSCIDPNPGYDIWSNILGCVGDYFSDDLETACQLIENWSPDENQGTMYKLKNRKKRISIGTLIYHAKKGGFDMSKLPGYEKPNKNKQFSPPETPDGYPYTDLGNSERFLEKYGDKVKFNYTDGFWYIWNGTKWEKDLIDKVTNFAKQIADELYNYNLLELSQRGKNFNFKEHLNHAKYTQSKPGLDRMLSISRNSVGCLVEDFDNEKFKINLENGIYDLNKHELLKHERKYMMSKIIDVDYQPNAECPKWQKFMTDIMNEDHELILFIQRALGLSLCGAPLEEKLFFAYGTGKNGKSVFFKVIEYLFGEYYRKAPTSMFMLKHNDTIPNDIAMLPGSRLVVGAELPEGRSFDEATLKDLTGNDKITARFMRKEFFQFNPTHTIWIYGNHKPKIKGTDEGIWRRMCLIPFKVTIPEKQRRPQNELIEDLLTEKAGILSWILDGWADYLNEGLNPPEVVKRATDEYRTGEDIIAQFIEECCVENEVLEVKSKELFKVFQEWLQENGMKWGYGAIKFSNKIDEKGFEKFSQKGRAVVLKGISVNQEWGEVMENKHNIKTGQNGLNFN